MKKSLIALVVALATPAVSATDRFNPCDGHDIVETIYGPGDSEPLILVSSHCDRRPGFTRVNPEYVFGKLGEIGSENDDPLLGELTDVPADAFAPQSTFGGWGRTASPGHRGQPNGGRRGVDYLPIDGPGGPFLPTDHMPRDDDYWTGVGNPPQPAPVVPLPGSALLLVAGLVAIFIQRARSMA